MDRTCVFTTPGASDTTTANEWCEHYTRNSANVAKHWDLTFEFWSAYRLYRRLGDCPCQASKAALFDLDL
jgi:hypothetical protein